jgi:hypothetical protein
MRTANQIYTVLTLLRLTTSTPIAVSLTLQCPALALQELKASHAVRWKVQLHANANKRWPYLRPIRWQFIRAYHRNPTSINKLTRWLGFLVATIRPPDDNEEKNTEKAARSICRTMHAMCSRLATHLKCMSPENWSGKYDDGGYTN